MQQPYQTSKNATRLALMEENNTLHRKNCAKFHQLIRETKKCRQQYNKEKPMAEPTPLPSDAIHPDFLYHQKRQNYDKLFQKTQTLETKMNVKVAIVPETSLNAQSSLFETILPEAPISKIIVHDTRVPETSVNTEAPLSEIIAHDTIVPETSVNIQAALSEIIVHDTIVPETNVNTEAPLFDTIMPETNAEAPLSETIVLEAQNSSNSTSLIQDARKDEEHTYDQTQNLIPMKQTEEPTDGEDQMPTSEIDNQMLTDKTIHQLETEIQELESKLNEINTQSALEELHDIEQEELQCEITKATELQCEITTKSTEFLKQEEEFEIMNPEPIAQPSNIQVNPITQEKSWWQWFW